MEEKKQLLFVCYGLGIGGIEKCLVNLLNALPEDQFDLDILLMTPQYALKPQIRRNVHFYDEFEYILYSGGAMSEIRKRGGPVKNWRKVLKLVPFRYLDQHGGNGWKLYKKLPKTYDIAIAYSQNGYALYYVADKVSAKRKVLWYHNGAYEASEAERAQHKVYYPKFNSIVAVSNDCAAVLKKELPFVKDKILVLQNLCDSRDILERAKEGRPDSFTDEQLHIVTVGRMTKEKGALLALEACRQLCSRGYNICWHWVGDGDQSEPVREQAKTLGLEKRFLLEGNQTNPYPYIAAADIYVQPSFYEAYSTTVTEARILNRPIVATDVGGMRDQLRDGETAFIVPLEADAIADAVETLTVDGTLREAFSQSLKQESYDSSTALEAYLRTVLA